MGRRQATSWTGVLCVENCKVLLTPYHLHFWGVGYRLDQSYLVNEETITPRYNAGFLPVLMTITTYHSAHRSMYSGANVQTGREVMQLFIQTTALSSHWYEKRLSPRMPEISFRRNPHRYFRADANIIISRPNHELMTIL